MTTPRRPFYAEYAWAFDLLIDRPVKKECAAIVEWLTPRRVLPGAALLDAGCGTGRYAAELARRGYVVHGIDLSPELIAEARRTAAETPSLVFAEGDFSDLPSERFDAILCRGVLNDVLEDRDRERVFAAFARALRSSGVLIFDVREWETTAVRKRREPLFKKRVATDRGTLTFESVTELDPEGRRLIVSESHTLEHDRHGTQSAHWTCVMRCWTRDELDSRLSRHGFDDAAYFGAYDPGIAAGTTDRLVIVASRPGAVAQRV